MCPDFVTHKIVNFPFGTNGKLIILCVSILMHITVSSKQKNSVECGVSPVSVL